MSTSISSLLSLPFSACPTSGHHRARSCAPCYTAAPPRDQFHTWGRIYVSAPLPTWPTALPILCPHVCSLHLGLCEVWTFWKGLEGSVHSSPADHLPCPSSHSQAPGASSLALAELLPSASIRPSTSLNKRLLVLPLFPCVLNIPQVSVVLTLIQG